MLRNPIEKPFIINFQYLPMPWNIRKSENIPLKIWQLIKLIGSISFITISKIEIRDMKSKPAFYYDQNYEYVKF